MGGKADDNLSMKQKRSPEKIVVNNSGSSSSLRHAGDTTGPHKGSSKKRSTDAMQTAGNIQQKPLIHLPHKPQIPSNTKPLNPNYTYQTISSITKSDCEEKSVNLFGVVSEIIKPISTTKTNKYMLVCTLMDDSDDDKGKIKFHFFTPEDTTIKQIELGDVLRLHRVKLETYNDKVDGRVFSSCDVVLFKKTYPDTKPITGAKTTVITDDDKKRVNTLKKWFLEFVRRPTLLSDICRKGNYCICCKVVKILPKKEEDLVIINVTDGSAIKSLVPAIPLVRYNAKKEGKKDHIVTEIICPFKLEEYARLKAGDFVFFCDVKAVPAGDDNFRLKVNTDTFPEVLNEKTIIVADIECRIAQSLKSVNMLAASKELNDLNEKDIETSIQTRQQRMKQKTPPVKNNENPAPHNSNKESSPKPACVMSTPKDDSDTRNTESDPGNKSRKQLFTPNYKTDLSDAVTDETSEHNLDMAQHALNIIPPVEVMNPANTSYDEIEEKVKTKYCTQKRQGQLDSSQDKEDLGQRSSSRRSQEGNKNPLGMLEPLSNIKGCQKRILDTLEDDLDDVETVINSSCQPTLLNKSKLRAKRTRLESLSTEEGNQRIEYRDDDQESKIRNTKVTSWLLHPNNKIPSTFQEDILNNELSLEAIKQILDCDDTTSDMSVYVSSSTFRIQPFLLGVQPDPTTNPFDLVSGFCGLGCRRIYLFSTLKWGGGEDTSIPLCPQCFLLEQEKELELMFVLELLIMDTNGQHGTVMVARKNAEQFLSCSVADYLRDKVVRLSRVQLLTEYTMRNTYNARNTPRLDIEVCAFNYTSSSTAPLFVFNSTLKLPRF